MPKKLIEMGNVRGDRQRRVMERIEALKECPFCEENLKKYHKQKIIKQGKYWTLTPNQWPYDDTELHLLAIARKHVERLDDLSKAAFTELLELFQWAERKYKLDYGAIAMRFGDVGGTGATVLHLHAHLIVANPDPAPGSDRVRFPIGPKPPKQG